VHPWWKPKYREVMASNSAKPLKDSEFWGTPAATQSTD
jgi:hypothetical protein